MFDESQIKIQSEKNPPINSMLICLGSIFIFTAFFLYLSMSWHNLTTAGRLAFTAGVGVTCYTSAMILMNHKRYDILGMAAYVVALILLTQGLLVICEKYFPEWSREYYPAFMFSFSLMLLFQSITFYIKRHELVAIGLVIYSHGLFNAWAEYIHLAWQYKFIVIGGALIAMVYFGRHSVFKRSSPFWNFFGAIVFLTGLVTLLAETKLQFLFFIATAALVYLSIIEHSMGLLFIATTSSIIYIFYLTHEYFVHSLGWPLTLFSFGIVLLTLSYVIMRVKSKK